MYTHTTCTAWISPRKVLGGLAVLGCLAMHESWPLVLTGNMPSRLGPQIRRKGHSVKDHEWSSPALGTPQKNTASPVPWVFAAACSLNSTYIIPIRPHSWWQCHPESLQCLWLDVPNDQSQTIKTEWCLCSSSDHSVLWVIPAAV